MIWIELAAGLVLLLAAFAITGWRLSRAEGAVFLVGCAAYLLVQLSPGSGSPWA